MDNYLELFVYYLKNIKHMAQNSLAAYRRDIEEFHDHLRKSGISSPADISNTDVVSYIMSLRKNGRASSTINRKMASLRSYCAFLCGEGVLTKNPAENIRPPQAEKKELDYLTLDEVDRILTAPDDSPKGMRDRAILEILYGTGIRVTEAAVMRMKDINFRIGFVTCSGEYGKARIIPLGRPCREALERYLDKARPFLIENLEKNAECAAESSQIVECVNSKSAVSCREDTKDEKIVEVREHEAGAGNNSVVATREASAGNEIFKVNEENDTERRQDGSEVDRMDVPQTKGQDDDMDYVFVNYQGKKLTRQGIWKIVRTYADKAGISKKLTPQILRNSFAVHMVQNGADLKSIQELMGYEDLATTQVYLTVTKNRIKEVYDRTHPRA